MDKNRIKKIQVDCRICHTPNVVLVRHWDYVAWQVGFYTQDVMPYLTPGQRELLISQTCEPCFDAMFPPEYDEDF